MRRLALVVVALIAAIPSVAAAQQDNPPMTFFVTSVGMGNGADLNGLIGALGPQGTTGGGLGVASFTVRAGLVEVISACRRGRQNLACLPEHRSPNLGQCAGPYRRWPVAQPRRNPNDR